MKKYEGVWDYFNHAHVVRPMTSKELLLTIEKSQGSIHKELNNLIKHNMLERVEIDVFERKITFYRKCKNDDN